MGAEKQPFILTIPTDLAMMSCARAFLVAVCQSHGVDPTVTEGMALAAHEALSNVIRHSHHHRRDIPIQLRCYVEPDRLEIQILDEGDPFDLSNVPELDPGELRIGGRGVFLMKALTDELICERRGERGNLLRLVKRSPTKAPSPASE